MVDASLYEVEGAASLDEAGYRRALERKLLLQKLERYKQLGDEHGVQATEGYLAWFDGQLAGRDTIIPGRFSLADVALFSFVEFGGMIGQPIDPAHKNVQAWFEKTQSRASAQA